ncbi:MAG: YbjQ family protein [Rudaea sp.]
MSAQPQPQPAQPHYQFNPAFVTTAFDFEGYHVARYLGVVRGITVRSRSALGQFAAGVQQIFGGNITIYTELCEHARQEAFEIMVQHAAQIGANAIIGVRYDANDVTDGVTEVLCYGTAVVVEPVKPNIIAGPTA